MLSDRKMTPACRVLAALAILTLPALDPEIVSAQEGVHSPDDRGFSIVLVSPTDIYLTGRRMVRIEAIIPRGDAMEQVDFFLDGRLASIDSRPPYAHEADFGPDIQRHTIEVRGLTRQGRRTKVSFVSRSGDVAEGAVGPIATLAAVVRDPAGGLVDGLTVSDFQVLENGERRPIVHFESGGSPASVAIISATGEALPAPELGGRLAAFVRGLPRHHAALMVAGSGAAAFSYALGGVADEIAALDPPFMTAPETLPERLSQAATALLARRGPRVLLAVVLVDKPAEPPPEGAAPAEQPAAPAPAKPPAGGPPAPDPLDAALLALRQARVALYFILLGPGAISPSPRLEGEAAASGGELVRAEDLAGFEQALQGIAQALQKRYLISYMPDRPESAGRRTVLVSVGAERLTVQAPTSVGLP